MSENRGGKACSEGGKPNSFCVPCSRKRSPVIIRRIDNACGVQDSRPSLVILILLAAMISHDQSATGSMHSSVSFLTLLTTRLTAYASIKSASYGLSSDFSSSAE